MTTPIPNHPDYITFSVARGGASRVSLLDDNNKKRDVSGRRVKPVDLENWRMQQDESRQQDCDARHPPKKKGGVGKVGILHYQEH